MNTPQGFWRFSAPQDPPEGAPAGQIHLDWVSSPRGWHAKFHCDKPLDDVVPILGAIQRLMEAGGLRPVGPYAFIIDKTLSAEEREKLLLAEINVLRKPR